MTTSLRSVWSTYQEASFCLKDKNKKGSCEVRDQAVKELPGDNHDFRWHTLKLQYFTLFLTAEKSIKIKCPEAVSNPGSTYLNSMTTYSVVRTRSLHDAEKLCMRNCRG